MRRLSPNAVMEQYWWLFESGTNRRKMFQKAKEQLEQTGTPFLGVILNKFNIKAAEYGSYGGYGSYGEYGKK